MSPPSYGVVTARFVEELPLEKVEVSCASPACGFLCDTVSHYSKAQILWAFFPLLLPRIVFNGISR